MSDLVRVHCPNYGRTCARVFEEDGVEYWETNGKVIPYRKFKSSAWLTCPNFDRYANGLTDSDECHAFLLATSQDVLAKVKEARRHGLRHMTTGPGWPLSSPLGR